MDYYWGGRLLVGGPLGRAVKRCGSRRPAVIAPYELPWNGGVERAMILDHR